jgi:biopolymer transport protein ExbB
MSAGMCWLALASVVYAQNAGTPAEPAAEPTPAQALTAAAPAGGILNFSLDPVTWWQGVTRLVELGGWVVIIQLSVSVLGLAIVMYKAAQFMRVRSGALANLHRAIDAYTGGDRKQALDMLGRNGLPFARDVEHALTHLRDDNIETVREELYRRARVYLQPLHDHLPAIEIIYYIAPLLGLLGTVTGIIASFQALEASGAANDAAKLAGGIWEALIATGVGLSMAIPFAVLHSLLETRLNRIVSAIEDLISRVFTATLDAAPAASEARKRA